MVTCAQLGLRAKYIGTIGDDERGRIQMESLRGSGINLDHVQQRAELPEPIGLHHHRSIHRRTHGVLEPSRLPGNLARRDHARIRSPARGCCTSTATIRAAVEHAARIARDHGIPVTVDVDTIYAGFERVLPLRRLPDREFRISRAAGPASKIPSTRCSTFQRNTACSVAAMTLGAHGALALTERRVSFTRPRSW